MVVRWCGRLISAAGSKFDPRRIEGILKMSPPSTGADLQQFLCALNWMRTAIPAFLRWYLHYILFSNFLTPARAASAPKPQSPESLFLKWGGPAHTPKRSKNVKVRWQTRRPSLIPRPTNASAYTPMLLRTFGPLSLPRPSPKIWISRRNNNGMSPSHFSPDRSPDLCDGGLSLRRRHMQ
jgi:hypothetical protein